MNRRGFTLIEVLVAAALVAISTFGVVLLFQQGSSSLRRVNESSSFTRALFAIEKDVMRDMPFIPPQEGNENATLAAAFEQTIGGVTTLFPYVAEFCYDRSGARVADCTSFDTDFLKAYRAQFFKERVLDLTINAASPLAQLPMSRVRFRVFYKNGTTLEPPFFFSRLETGAIRY